MTRTSNYVMTVDFTNKSDDERLSNLRAQVCAENKENTTKKYVKLQGRGHRLGNRRYNQSLPLSFAQRADVYIYER